jgi:hypothetical protein
MLVEAYECVRNAGVKWGIVNALSGSEASWVERKVVHRGSARATARPTISARRIRAYRFSGSLFVITVPLRHDFMA